MRDGKPVIARSPQLNFVDDKDGKPIGIHQHIGRRPIAAFGDSDGDLPMLEWTISGPGARLGFYAHHDDAVRDFAYDRASAIGKPDRGFDEAPQRGWTVVSIKDDWNRVFGSDK